MMRFKVDENLHRDFASWLGARGHDAQNVWDEGIQGIDDAALSQVVRTENRVLVTFDLGFADIRRYPPADHAGIVVLRLPSQHRAAQLAAASRIVELAATEPLAGSLWIVEETLIRIRGKGSS